jgi:hypothetical protein
MQKTFFWLSNNWLLLIIFSVFVYIISGYYKFNYENALYDSRENNRNFIINLSKEFKSKAGIFISKNNFDPIMPNTLLKILLRTEDNYISSYSYNGKNLVIYSSGSPNITDIKDIISYLVVTKNKNKYTLYLE